MVVTVAIRVVLFPLILTLQRLAARMNELKPEMEERQAKLAELKAKGDTMAFQREGQKFMQWMKQEKSLSV